jgi:hypothetical protein
LKASPKLRWASLLATAAASGGGASCDPVLDDAVAALGPETPGVPPGPLHRPGQPCLLCHDGAFGDPRAFSVAGTLFQIPSSPQPAVAASVAVTDSTGSTHDLTSNAAGNFYLPASEWTPVLPLQVVVESQAGAPVYMFSLAETGGCATCHQNPPGPDSPGQVCLTLDDGGAPR